MLRPSATIHSTTSVFTARYVPRIVQMVPFSPQLPREAEVACFQLVRSLKKSSQNLNPENSLNQTVFGTARHVQRAEHEGHEWRLNRPLFWASNLLRCDTPQLGGTFGCQRRAMCPPQFLKFRFWRTWLTAALNGVAVRVDFHDMVQTCEVSTHFFVCRV